MYVFLNILYLMSVFIKEWCKFYSFLHFSTFSFFKQQQGEFLCKDYSIGWTFSNIYSNRYWLTNEVCPSGLLYIIYQTCTLQAQIECILQTVKYLLKFWMVFFRTQRRLRCYMGNWCICVNKNLKIEFKWFFSLAGL